MEEKWEGIAQVKIELLVLKPEIGVSFPLDIRKYLARSLREISSFYRRYSEKYIFGLPFSSCFLKYLYVDPVYRGKGLGKLLLKHLKTKFKAIGLLVEKGEEQAKAFYEKQGFRLVGTLPHVPTGKMYWGFIWTKDKLEST